MVQFCRQISFADPAAVSSYTKEGVTISYKKSIYIYIRLINLFLIFCLALFGFAFSCVDSNAAVKTPKHIAHRG